MRNYVVHIIRPDNPSTTDTYQQFCDGPINAIKLSLREFYQRNRIVATDADVPYVGIYDRTPAPRHSNPLLTDDENERTRR